MPNPTSVIVIAHDIRSVHNIGSILRTADGFGVAAVYCTGFSPYPELPNDERPPHTRRALTAQLHKTALGAETTMAVRHSETLGDACAELADNGYEIYALEQTPDSLMLSDFCAKQPPAKLAIVLGNEPNGLSPDDLAHCVGALEIPMVGHKESFNVSVAAGIALYAVTRR